MKQIQIFLIDNWKTTVWALYSALLVLVLTNEVISQDLFNVLLGAGVAAGFATSKDADTVKLEAKQKIDSKNLPKNGNLYMIALLAGVSLLFITLTSSCGQKGFGFTKYAVKTGFDVAEDAGAFRARSWQINTQFQGDTIFYYRGVNSYLIMKQDTLYVIDVVLDRQALEDTTIHYLKSLGRKVKDPK